MDIEIFRCPTNNIVDFMETIHAQTQIETLHMRMRLIRESRHLTLIQAAKLSKGRISAIALGSYERGDRSVSALKLITIANLYEVRSLSFLNRHDISCPKNASVSIYERFLQLLTP